MPHHHISHRLRSENLLFREVLIPVGREVSARERGMHGGGVDGVAAGIAVGEFHSEAFVEGEHGGFRGAVVDEARGDDVGGDRGDGHNVAFAGFEHFREDWDGISWYQALRVQSRM